MSHNYWNPPESYSCPYALGAVLKHKVFSFTDRNYDTGNKMLNVSSPSVWELTQEVKLTQEVIINGDIYTKDGYETRPYCNIVDRLNHEFILVDIQWVNSYGCYHWRLHLVSLNVSDGNVYVISTNTKGMDYSYRWKDSDILPMIQRQASEGELGRALLQYSKSKYQNYDR